MKERIVLFAIFLAAFSEMGMAGTVEKLSDDGLFIVRAQIEPPRPVVGNNIVTLTIFDSRSKTPIEGAVIEAVPWMTMHGHGSSKKTRISERGKGIYTVENVYFTMPGDWDLLIKIQKNKVEDKGIVTFRSVKN